MSALDHLLANNRTWARSLTEREPEFFQRLVDSQWAVGTGSATRVARALVLLDPPSIDRGEVTDKGSINQRAVLTQREALVEHLYAGGDGVYRPQR